jgi:O-methyltransferase involved in polyketide biosynthesis
MKVSLKEEMETLLIPLYGKAQMSRKGLFQDREAEEAVAQIDYDFSKLHIQEKTQVMLSIRGALIDDYAAGYLKEHPGGTAVYLGCGLDARQRRIGAEAGLWYDLDFPEVIGIKKQLYEETAQYKYIPSSVTEWGWMDRVETNGRPVLVVAEGLFMYLSGEDVKSLIIRLRDNFKDIILIFDAYSALTARQAKHHPSLKKTGAVIQWGVDTPGEIEAFGSGISHLKTLYLTDKSAIANLPFGYRSMFGLAGSFKAAREAHRIFLFKLTSKSP